MNLSYRILGGSEKGRTGTIRIEPGRPAWIGRADESYGTSIVLPDAGVSALHACIVLDATGWPAICDNRSTNGLFRLGQSVSHAPFRSGERFQVGRGGPEVEFTFAEAPQSAPRAEAAFASAPTSPEAPAPGAGLVVDIEVEVEPTVRWRAPNAPLRGTPAVPSAPPAPAPAPAQAPTPPQTPIVATPIVPLHALPAFSLAQPTPPIPPPAPPAAAKPHPALPARTRTAQTERARKAVAAEGYVPIERVPGRDPIIVFRAKRPGIDHEVMVEVLLHQSEYETPDERRFLRAARLAAKLRHPNLISLYDARITDEYDLLVFESLHGRTLQAEIDERRGLPPQRVLAVAADAARGLSRIHELRFVHRGLKPDAVMITEDGQVKLIAMGLLRPAAPEPEDDGSGTQPGDILGSLAHMAPEQTRSAAEVDARADVYALGATMYHALAGRPPHADVSRLVTGGDPLPIGRLVPGTPPALAALVTRCMLRDPRQRYASGAEVLAEIERVAATLRAPSAAPAAARGHAPMAGGMPTVPSMPGQMAGGALSSAGFFAGRLRGMQIVELLQMVELHDESGTLEIMADEGARGQLSFTGGRVVDATCGAKHGEEAAYALLAVQKGFFRMAYGKVEANPAAPTIGAILFEHMRRTDEGGAPGSAPAR